MADSGMFAMVCGHGISAFPSHVDYDGVFLRRGKQVNVSLVRGKVVHELIFTERDLEIE